MKRLKKYIVLILSIVTAIFVLPLTACGEDYDKDVVGVDGFTREQVIEIRRAYVKNYHNNDEQKVQYVYVKKNFGSYQDVTFVIIKYEEADCSVPAVEVPVYLNKIYICSLNDPSYSLICMRAGDCKKIEDAYITKWITDEDFPQIIELAKTKGYYDEKVNNSPTHLGI